MNAGVLLQVKDEEGRLMNDFTGRIKRDEWRPPTGAPLSSARFALCSVLDVSAILVSDFEAYSHLTHILMRGTACQASSGQ